MRKIRAYPQVRSCSQLPNTYTAHPNTETTANIVAKTKYSRACEKCGLSDCVIRSVAIQRDRRSLPSMQE